MRRFKPLAHGGTNEPSLGTPNMMGSAEDVSTAFTNSRRSTTSSHLASFDISGNLSASASNSCFLRRRIDAHRQQQQQQQHVTGDDRSASALSVPTSTTAISSSCAQQQRQTRQSARPSPPPLAPKCTRLPGRGPVRQQSRATMAAPAAPKSSLQLPPPRFPSIPLSLPQFAKSAVVASVGSRPLYVTFDGDLHSDDDDDDANASITSLSTSSSSALVEMHGVGATAPIASPAVTTVVVRRTISRVDALKRLDALRQRGLLGGTKRPTGPSV